MRHVISVLLLAASLMGAKPVPGETLSEVIGPERNQVRTWVFGDSAKAMYELLERNHTGSLRSFAGCWVIQAQGITCASRHLGLPEDDERRKYACVFQLDQEGIDPNGPAEHFCVPTAGVGVGNF